MPEDVKEVKEVQEVQEPATNAAENVTQATEAPKAIDVNSLRFMTVEQLDNMILYVVNSQPDAFNMYFALQKAKASNLVRQGEKSDNPKDNDKS